MLKRLFQLRAESQYKRTGVLSIYGVVDQPSSYEEVVSTLEDTGVPQSIVSFGSVLVPSNLLEDTVCCMFRDLDWAGCLPTCPYYRSCGSEVI